MAKRVSIPTIKSNDDTIIVEPVSIDNGSTTIVDTIESRTVDEPEFINGFETVDPGSGADSDSGTRRRRGRPPGSGNTARSQKTSKNDLGGIETILFSLHVMAASFFETPELMLAPGEAKALADAAAKVASHYDTRLNPKVLAWVNLLMVAGGVYGSRIVAIRARVKSEDAPKPKVVPMGGKFNPSAPIAKTPADMFGLNYNANATAAGD